MLSQWTVTPLAQQWGAAQDLATLEQCFAQQGKLVSKGPHSQVTLHEVNEKKIYTKRYKSGGSGLRQYFFRSRVRAEWENLQWFADHGINTLPVLAFGEEYRLGKFVRGALVTAQLPAASDLEQLAKSRSDVLFAKTHFVELAKQIAAYVKTMHDRGFTHNDLDWRNILISPTVSAEGEKPSVYFFDCPSGRHWVWPFLEYRIIKDLSHLDKIARDCLPARWRLWFYRQYTGRNKLTAKDKRRIRKIVAYYDGR